MIKKLIQRILGGRKAETESRTPHDPTQPTVLGPAEHGIKPELVSSNAIRVTSSLQEAGFKAFVVGGAVRDLLLGVKPKDFDIATNATPEQIKRLFRRAFIIGRRFQIVHVMFGQDLLEVTTFRGAAATEAQKDEHGRVLRDNTFGEQHEDAVRRDFTINAMYYDPATQTVLDYHGGMADIRAKVLRIIGAPEARLREDPVRMLRAVRLAAKLDFSIDDATSKLIPVMAPLINNVPAARVFDEMLKLLLSGHAWTSLQRLRKEGLHHGLLPLLDVVLEQPMGEKFVKIALGNTDERVRQSKPVSPGFLFASLLWHQALEKWKAYQAAGEQPIPALHLAADDVLNAQTDTLALQRRIASDMRDIWAMQPRFERRTGKAPYRLIEHPRMRAGYDFLLLRCASGELDTELGDWWTEFIDADGPGREALLQRKLPTPEGGAAKRPRKRGGRNKRAAGDAAPEPSGDALPDARGIVHETASDGTRQARLVGESASTGTDVAAEAANTTDTAGEPGAPARKPRRRRRASGRSESAGTEGGATEQADQGGGPEPTGGNREDQGGSTAQ